MFHCRRNTNSMWSQTTNELGVNGVDNEHEDQEGTNPRGETIREDYEGVASKPIEEGKLIKLGMERNERKIFKNM